MDRADRIRSLFEQVVELDADERAARLEQLCAGEDSLRRELEQLLAALDAPPPILRNADTIARTHMEQIAGADQEGERIDQYELLEWIGEGAFGIVWKAREHGPLDRTVALKVLKSGVGDDAQRRFTAECGVLAKLSHPNIARVLSAGTARRGRPYIAMEFVDGPRLIDYCREHGLGLRERLMLFEQVCRAIHHAHELNFVHRDLKPANILVEELDGQPFVKVIDFGIAHFLDGEEGETDPPSMLGSIGYMSPEQVAEPTAIDRRADIYSLGAILHELIADRPLVSARDLRKSADEDYQSWLRGFKPRPPSSRMRRLGSDGRSAELRGLDRVVGKAIAHDPDSRYATANDLVLAVRAVLGSLPASPRALRRALGSRPALLVAGLLAVAAIVSLGVVLRSWSADRTLLGELTTGGWFYSDHLYPPGDWVSLRASDDVSGRFVHRHEWFFQIWNEDTVAIDFWDDGDSLDVYLKFDPERQCAQGEFVDERGRRHQIELRRSR